MAHRSSARRARTRLAACLAAMSLAIVFAVVSPRIATADPGWGSYANLDNAPVEAWHRFTEGPPGFEVDAFAYRLSDGSAPTGDGIVFNMGMHSNPRSIYSNLYEYQDKPYTAAKDFVYTVAFKFAQGPTPELGPQALEFPFSIYKGAKRLEMAAQWVALEGPPRWRLWDGSTRVWTETHNDPGQTPRNFLQTLTPNTWHYFAMVGSIQNDKVTYNYLFCDGKLFNARGDTYTAGAGDGSTRTVIAYQVDNNALGQEQSIRLDGLSLYFH